MEWKQSPRPCYDMVEEYNRSLDEYKDKVSPPVIPPGDLGWIVQAEAVGS